MRGIDPHTQFSRHREQILEHWFIGECLKRLWAKGYYDVDVLRAGVDSSGYDIVLEMGQLIRHIQLKVSTKDDKPMNLNASLLDKPSGCVVWMVVERKTLALTRFRWLGNEFGDPCPDFTGRKAKRTTANVEGVKPERRNTYKVNLGKFQIVETIDEVVRLLFRV